jgi:hypothetical protein
MAFVRYSSAYVGEEKQARHEQRGLWTGAFIAPWDWRHREAAARNALRHDRPEPKRAQCLSRQRLFGRGRWRQRRRNQKRRLRPSSPISSWMCGVKPLSAARVASDRLVRRNASQPIPRLRVTAAPAAAQRGGSAEAASDIQGSRRRLSAQGAQFVYDEKYLPLLLVSH